MHECSRAGLRSKLAIGPSTEEAWRRSSSEIVSAYASNGNCDYAARCLWIHDWHIWRMEAISYNCAIFLNRVHVV